MLSHPLNPLLKVVPPKTLSLGGVVSVPALAGCFALGMPHLANTATPE